MLIDYFIKRIWDNSIKNILIVILLIFPLVEVGFYLWFIYLGRSVSLPDYSFFLLGNSAGIEHLPQSIFLWFFPLYFLIICAEDCFEDRKIGMNNVLITKVGKRQYIKSHLIKSFLIAFMVVMTALLMNLVIVHIIFSGGKYIKYDDAAVINTVNSFYKWEIEKPLLTNLLFTFITSLFAGLISTIGTITALVIKDKKITYVITLVFWFVPFLQKNSLMYLFQPHTEYTLDSTYPIALSVGGIYLVYIIIGYIKEAYFEKTIL